MTDDLFALALDLTERESGRPKQASIRRAISSAYYGLFHALLRMFADQVAGRGARNDDVYASIYRYPEHATLLRKLLEIDDRDVRAIAATLKILQQLRMQADYDPLPFGMGKSEAQELIIQAREAANAVRLLKPKQRLATTAAILSSKRR